MTVLLLVRHGQTEWNRIERFRGRADLALDATGVRQAGAIAGKVAEWPVSAIYSSPLRRAAATAAAVADRLGLKVSILDGLNDLDFGEWEGLSPREAEARDPELWQKWVRTPHLVTFPGGGSLDTVRGRAVEAVNGVAKRHEGGAVVLVSHRLVCQVLLLHFLGLENSGFWRLVQDVAAVNVVNLTHNGPAVVTLNDTCHLKGLETPQAGVHGGSVAHSAGGR